MMIYILFLSLSLLSSPLTAEESIAEVEHNKRTMIDKAVQNVNTLFDAMLVELDETHVMYNTSCKKAQEREQELQTQLMSLEKENEQMRTIQAELNMAQKDLQKAMDTEAELKNKITLLQQVAGREISHMRGEFEAFKSRLEAKTNNIDKIFW